MKLLYMKTANAKKTIQSKRPIQNVIYLEGSCSIHCEIAKAFFLPLVSCPNQLPDQPLQQYTEQKYLIKDIWFGRHAHLSGVTGQPNLIHKNTQLVTMLTDDKNDRFGKSGKPSTFFVLLVKVLY